MRTLNRFLFGLVVLRNTVIAVLAIGLGVISLLTGSAAGIGGGLVLFAVAGVAGWDLEPWRWREGRASDQREG